LNINNLIQRWSTLSISQIEDEIVDGENQEEVTQLIGADKVAEIRATSFAAPMAGPREGVVLLPGIMGSLLASIRGVATLVWINPLVFLQGNGRYLRLDPDGTSDECAEVEIVPIGLEKLTYLQIAVQIRRQAILHEFPYDWRRPIEYNADVLHASLERWSEGDPSRKFTLVAHSMGGLVSRTYMARHPKSAEQRVKRLIMHGTPNFGATGAIDNLFNGNAMMATVDLLNNANGMRQLAFCLPSVYQLLPAPRDFFPTDRPYPVSFDHFNAAAWGLPAIQQKYLDGARSLYQALNASDPQIPMVVISGCNIKTLVGAILNLVNGRIQFQPSLEDEGDNSGDGTVPLWSARLPRAETFFIQEVHRDLPNNGQVIQATLDLINDGTCKLPQTIPPRKLISFAEEIPVSPEVKAEELRAKIKAGILNDRDLRSLFTLS